MALITCPECQKQISDQAATCPNCGFPLPSTTPDKPLSTDGNDMLPADQTIEENISTEVAPAKPKKKVIAISVVAVLCVALLAAVAVFINSNAKKRAAEEARYEYISNLQLFVSTTLQGAAKAETACNLTKQVWYDTIYEKFDVDTVEYTKTDGEFNEDFNTSLQRLYASADMIQSVEEIKANQESVDEIYKLLLNPNSEFEKCFDEVEALYSVYRQLTNLAISPSGSLKTYSEDFGDYDDSFMEHYEKLNLLMPEKQLDD